DHVVATEVIAGTDRIEYRVLACGRAALETGPNQVVHHADDARGLVAPRVVHLADRVLAREQGFAQLAGDHGGGDVDVGVRVVEHVGGNVFAGFEVAPGDQLQAQRVEVVVLDHV